LKGCSGHGLISQTLQQSLGLEDLLVYQSSHILQEINENQKHSIVIKGGASMEIRFGPNVRVTRDIDAATNLNLFNALAMIEESLIVGWNGFTGTMTAPEDINIPGDNKPQRCKIKISYKSKPFMTLPFEIGFIDKKVDSYNEVVTNTISLEPVQLEAGNKVSLLGIPAQIAQKIHACTQMPEFSTNNRCHDLYDITLMEPLARKDLRKLKEACEHVFKIRDTHHWPPDIKEWDHWQDLWDKIDAPIKINYQEARQIVNKLIEDTT